MRDIGLDHPLSYVRFVNFWALDFDAPKDPITTIPGCPRDIKILECTVANYQSVRRVAEYYKMLGMDRIPEITFEEDWSGYRSAVWA